MSNFVNFSSNTLRQSFFSSSEPSLRLLRSPPRERLRPEAVERAQAGGQRQALRRPQGHRHGLLLEGEGQGVKDVSLKAIQFAPQSGLWTGVENCTIF